jgi:hypothetical protein
MQVDGGEGGGEGEGGGGGSAAARKLVRELVRRAVADWAAGKGEKPAGLAAKAAGTIPGELARYAFDERRPDGKFASTLADDRPATSPADNTLVPGKEGHAIRLTGDHAVTTPVGNFRRSHPFTVSLWLQAPPRHDRAVVFHRSRAWTDAASRGYELLVAEGHLRWSLVHFWPGDAVSVRAAEPLPVGAAPPPARPAARTDSPA